LLIGQCIYCGVGHEGQLSDEHVVPLALHGNYVLRDASCEACRHNISGFETALLRGGFRAAREAFVYNSRSKSRPQTLPVFDAHGVTDSRMNIPVGDYPVTLIMPTISGPQIDDLPYKQKPGVMPWLYRSHNFDVLSAKHNLTKFASNSLDVRSFFRTLAKVAHGLAVGAFGLNGFVPFLRPVILEPDYPAYSRFIGMIGVQPQPLLEKGFEVEIGVETLGESEYVSARIRFFPELNTPFYRVIAGALPDSSAALAKWKKVLEMPPLDPHEAAPLRIELNATRNK